MASVASKPLHLRSLRDPVLPLPDGLQTGDTLACWGKSRASGVISRLTQWRIWQRRAPSHIAGIVIENGEPLVYESTTQSTLPDCITGRTHRGIQCHRLQDWLDAYNGRVELLRLKTRMRPHSLARAVAYAKDCHTMQVTYDLRGAIRAGSPLVNVEDGTELFCSEFWGFFLRYGGAVGAHVNCSELTPWNVYRLPCFLKPVQIKPPLTERTPGVKRFNACLAAAVCVVGLILGCVTQSPPDASAQPQPRVSLLDRDAIRAEITPLLDDVEMYLREVGESDAAGKIQDARAIGRELLVLLESGSDNDVASALARLDRAANAAIGLIPDPEKRLLARGGYFLARRAIARAGVILDDPPLPATPVTPES